MNTLPRRTPLPSAVILLIVTCLVYFVQASELFNFYPFALLPIERGFQPWQLVSYGFLHGSFLHLFFNMFALYMFGLAIEQAWGTKRFLIYYFVCLVGAGLLQLVMTSVMGSPRPTIGASGAVFGILLAFGMMYPNQRILLIFPPIPMKAKWFVIVYGLLTLFFGVTGTMAGIAHFAHLGGMLFGFVLILYWGRQDFQRRRR
ncbi:MAG: rhomboid family intramembrane serine protease [Pseudomonadota bacterium]